MSCSNIKLVTFDVTNTLLKFRQTPGRQYVQAGRPYGFQGTDEQISSQFRLHYGSMSRRYPNFGRSSPMTWEEWWREVVRNTFRDHIQDTSSLNLIATKLIEDYKRGSSWLVSEGTRQLLDHLKERRVKIGIVSNFDPRLHEILSNVQLRDYFDFVVTSYESGYSKPDSRIFETARMRSGHVAPEHALHIGDNVTLDYCGAVNAGWHALLVNSKITYENMENVHPNHVYKQLENLKDDIISEKLKFSFISAQCY